MLRDRDVPEADPGGWARVEHAVEMDVTQWLFEPAQPGGEPQLRTERMEKMIETDLITAREEDKQRLRQLTAADAQEAIQMFDSFHHRFYDMWKSSWPGKMPEEPDKLAEEYYTKNVIVGTLLPSL